MDSSEAIQESTIAELSDLKIELKDQKKFEDLLTQLLEEYLTKNGDIKTDKKKVVLDKKKNVGTGGKKCC